MLHRYINQFLEYCQLADFSVCSIQALTARLNEFETYLKSQKIRYVKKVPYRHLIDFVADYKAPSLNTRKKVSCLDAQTLLPLSDTPSVCAAKYCPQTPISEN